MTRSEIESLLDLDLLRQAVAEALAQLSAGRASMPTRIAANVPEQGALLAAMPAYLPAAGALTTKLVSLFPRNTDRPTHQAVIVAFDAATGTPAAILDGEAITAARTAAASAVALGRCPRRHTCPIPVGSSCRTLERRSDGRGVASCRCAPVRRLRGARSRYA